MTKYIIVDIDGKKSGEITTSIFNNVIREDIVQKTAEIQKINEKKPYSNFWLSGNQTSASGNVKHLRHAWKSDRGKGLSRYPKKRMSDKGERFVWVAAVAPGVRGGRRAHPPKLLRRKLKINKKELKLAMLSAIAMSASSELIKKKYSSLNDKEIKTKLPLIASSKITELKSKQFFNALSKILDENLIKIAIKEKKIRAGRGKMRNRRYKENAGMLFVVGNDEKAKFSGVEARKVKDLRLIDLASNGARLTMFTEKAIMDLERKLNFIKEKK